MDLKHVRTKKPHLQGNCPIDPRYPVTIDGLVLKFRISMLSTKTKARSFILVCSFLIYEFHHLYVGLSKVESVIFDTY